MILIADKNDFFFSQNFAFIFADNQTFADNHFLNFHSQKSVFNKFASVFDDSFIFYFSSQVFRRNLFIFNINMFESFTFSDNVQSRISVISFRKRLLQNSLFSNNRRRSKKIKSSKVFSNRNETDDDENRNNKQKKKKKKKKKKKEREKERMQKIRISNDEF